jgi:hypothetical protein
MLRNSRCDACCVNISLRLRALEFFNIFFQTVTSLPLTVCVVHNTAFLLNTRSHIMPVLHAYNLLTRVLLP